jgi:hypothetical protein
VSTQQEQEQSVTNENNPVNDELKQEIKEDLDTE